MQGVVTKPSAVQGQSEAVCRLVAPWLWATLPALWLDTVDRPMNRLLLAMQISRPQLVISAIGVPPLTGHAARGPAGLSVEGALPRRRKELRSCWHQCHAQGCFVHLLYQALWFGCASAVPSGRTFCCCHEQARLHRIPVKRLLPGAGLHMRAYASAAVLVLHVATNAVLVTLLQGGLAAAAVAFTLSRIYYFTLQVRRPVLTDWQPSWLLHVRGSVLPSAFAASSPLISCAVDIQPASKRQQANGVQQTHGSGNARTA